MYSNLCTCWCSCEVRRDQVFSDWFGGVRFKNGVAVESDKRKWSARVRAFLNAKGKQTVAEKKLPWNKKYLPNCEAISGLDGALQGFGLGLGDFGFVQKPRALLQHERRYFVEAAELPPAFAEDLGLLRRACIEDTTSNETWIETDWNSDRRLLVNALDCGSKARPGNFFLYSAGDIRGCMFFDPLHTRYNRFKTAVNESDLADAWSEGGVLVGLRKGPWAGASHYGTFKDIAENYFGSADYNDKLFRLVYPTIIFFKYKGALPLDAYSDDHMASVWADGPQIKLLHSKGTKEKASRWFDMPTNLEAMKEDFGWLQLLLMRRALEDNWYASVQDSPLFRTSLAYVPVEPTPPQAPGTTDATVALAVPSRAVSSIDPMPLPSVPLPPLEASEATFEQQRADAKCVMHLACNIACTLTKLKLMCVIVVGGKASSDFHSANVKLLKTQSGSVEWWRLMAMGEWKKVVIAETKLFEDELKLKERR